MTFTYDLFVKFPTNYGIGQVQRDQSVDRECYLAMLAMNEHVQTMNIEERRVVAEPTEVLKTFLWTRISLRGLQGLEQAWKRR